MANEFVARRGIIAQSGGARVTGSLLVSGSINALGYNVIADSFTGSFSGSIGTAVSSSYVDWSGIGNKPSGIVSSSGQVDVRNTTGISTLATTGSNIFIGTQTIQGNIFLSSSFPLVYNNDSTNNMLFGFYDGSQIYGAYYQIFGNNYPVVAQRGGAEFVFDTRNGGDANFHVSSYNGTTWTQRFRVDVNGAQVTGSVDVTGAVTASAFKGDGSQLTGIATTLAISGSTAGTDSLNLKTEALTFSGSNGITATVTDNTVTFAAPAGNVTSSTQIDIAQTTGYSTFSSSIATKNDSQDLAIAALSNVTGSYATTASNSFTGVQTITNTTNSTNYTDGALVVQGGVGITKDVNISGSLTVAGLLTAISMSTQYVTSSQYVVGDNKIILAADDVTRFGGMSIFDSGSTSPTTASIYWDSLNHKFIYENLSGSDYGSSIIIGGPKNTGPLGSEPVLTVGRIPVTTGEDHIDSRQASSSIRIDFNTKETHVESGLYITGSVTSSVGFKGDGSQLTGIVTTLAITGSDLSTDTIDLKTSGLTFNGGNGITTTVTSDTVTISAPLGTVSSSGQIKSLLPDGTVSSSAQYPGWVTASSQIQLNAITGTTFSNNAFLFPQDVTLTGDLTVAGNDIKNNNGTAVITFAGTSNNDVRLWSGGALDVQSGEIRNNGTTAIQMSGQNVQIINSGSMNAAKINNTYYSGSTPSTIVGPVTNQVVATVKAADYDASHFDYVIKDGTNYRTGTVMAVWDGTNVEFTDTSTNDIGNTSEVSFTVDINGGSIRLKITTGNGNWTLKTSIRAL